MTGGPSPTGWALPRPALRQRLDAALTHRLTVLVAAPGYGKTTLLRSWVEEVRGVHLPLAPVHTDTSALAGALLAALRLRVPELPSHTELLGRTPLGPSARDDASTRPAAVATTITELLAEQLRRHLALALDPVEVVAGDPDAVALLEALVRTAPPRLHVVLACRDGVPFPVARLRQQREVLELDATNLALSREEVTDWAVRRLGADGAALAPALRTSTGGWPALVHARLDELASLPEDQRVAAAARPGLDTSLQDLLIHAVRQAGPEAQELLQAMTVLPVLDDGLAQQLGAPRGVLAELGARGLLVDTTARGHRLSDAAREVVAAELGLGEAQRALVARTGIRSYLAAGDVDLALRTARAGGDPDVLVDLLESHGRALDEDPATVLQALDALDADRRDAPALIALRGVALHNQGQWDEAHGLLAAAADTSAFDATIAWRLGFTDHLRGDLARALQSYQRGAEHGRPAAAAAMCEAMAAAAMWLRGDRDECARLADRAMARSVALGDPRALAASHTVTAMLAAMDGDRRANDAHYLRALDYAQQAGDTIQQIRIRSNRASHHQEEGAYTEALAELEVAERLAEASGFGWFLALALSNRSEVLLGLGRLEEAAADAATAVQQWDRLGSQLRSYPEGHLAEVQVLRGEADAAEATLRRILDGAAEDGESQGWVPAAARLAELLAHDDPEEARRLAARALDHATGMTAVAARVAAATVALATGAGEEAADHLAIAEDLARERRDEPGLARVLELQALQSRDPALARAAQDRWEAVGDPVGRASAQLRAAEVGEGEVAPALLEEVEQAMRAIGCRALDERIAAVRRRAGGAGGDVVLQTLGGFRLRRGGAVVSRSQWQSRRARELLKILVAHRGRPVPREQVMEWLWPDDPAGPALRKRLNVQTSTLRSILDPDRVQPADHFVVSADGALRIDTEHLQVDVEGFLRAAAEGERLRRAGRMGEALACWEAAEAAYVGDFLAEDAYADWAVSLREEARLAYGQVTSGLAAVATAEGAHDVAARYLLRLLERDPYDEPSHLALVTALVAAGRHGDARRRYLLYGVRMRELGVEPAAYPHHPDGTRT